MTVKRFRTDNVRLKALTKHKSMHIGGKAMSSSGDQFEKEKAPTQEPDVPCPRQLTDLPTDLLVMIACKIPPSNSFTIGVSNKIRRGINAHVLNYVEAQRNSSITSIHMQTLINVLTVATNQQVTELIEINGFITKLVSQSQHSNTPEARQHSALAMAKIARLHIGIRALIQSEAIHALVDMASKDNTALARQDIAYTMGEILDEMDQASLLMGPVINALVSMARKEHNTPIGRGNIAVAIAKMATKSIGVTALIEACAINDIFSMAKQEMDAPDVRQHMAFAMATIAEHDTGIAAIIEIEGSVDALVSMFGQEDNTSDEEIYIAFVLAQIAQREDGIFRLMKGNAISALASMAIKESHDPVIRQNIALAITRIARTRIGLEALIQTNVAIDALVSMAGPADNAADEREYIAFAMEQIAQSKAGRFHLMKGNAIKALVSMYKLDNTIEGIAAIKSAFGQILRPSI